MQHFTRLALTAHHFRLRATHSARFGPTRRSPRLLCLLAALVALALFIFVAARPAHAQVVQNGGFETGSLSPWTETANGYTSVNTSPSGPHSGSWDTLFSNGSDQGPGQASIMQALGTAAGTSYGLTFFADSEAGTHSQQLTVTWGTPGAANFVTHTFDVSDSGYRQYTLTGLTALGAGTPLTFSVNFDGQQDRAIRLDDVRVATIRPVPSKYPTIQAALDASLDGDIVAVAPGTYTGAGNRDLDFGGRDITVQGTGGARQTIINCQGTSSANHRGFVFHSGETAAAVVQGFTIENGYTGGEGGGILVTGGSDPTITDCVFTGNHALYGGGVALDGAAATITRCAFLGNSAGVGGAVQAVFSSTLVCTDSVFAGNSATVATSGVLIYESSTGTVTNCTFTGNVSSASNGTLDVGNGDQDTATSSSGTVTNCILYGDTGDELSVNGVGTVSNNDIQGGFPGAGNISADPLFVSAAAPYDLHLQAGSPAIGLGTASAPDFPATDFDGNTWHTPPAAGAYEGTSATTSTGLKSTVNPSAVGQNVTFIATVANTSQGSSAIPAGTVTFSVDSGNVATVALDGNGQATYSTSSLTAGGHTVTATFAANVRFQGGASKPLTQTVVAAPTANAQSVSVAFNTAKGIILTGSDPNSPPRSLTYIVVSIPSHGTLSGTAPNLTYTPNAGYHGGDSFTFKVNNGVLDSNTATVTLNVATGTPKANPQSVSVAFNTAKGITLTGTDPDVPTLPLTYAVLTAPVHGTLSGFNAATGAVTYTPNTGYHGSDSFTFTASNGASTSAPATVTLTVAAGTPAANAQSVSTSQNTPVSVTLTGSDPDVPALPLTYSVTTSPAHGTLSGTAPNLTYTPAPGYYGADSFTFTVSNGTNTSTAATVSLTIAQGAAADVTAQITLTRGGFRYVRATGHYLQPLTLANTGAALADPISLVLDSLTGAALVNASGTTAAQPAGSPYVTLPTGGLAAGASVTVTLEFTAQPTGYSVRVLAGPGAR